MKEYNGGEYFISEIVTPDTAKILQKPFRALSLEFTNEEIISVMLEIDGNFQQKDNDENILHCILKLLNLQKKLRFLEARRLMLDCDKNVTEAAFEVGYECVSQFVREYKKILGLPPKEDISKIKNCAKILKNQASK